MHKLLYIFCLLVMVGCSASDEQKIKKESIYGDWKAESYDLDGIKIPIGAAFEVTPKKLTMITGDSKQTFNLSKIDIEPEDKIILNIENGIGITFHMVTPNKLYFQIPFIGTKIFYNKSSASI